MAISKTALPTEGSVKPITSLLNFGANTVSSANAFKHGTVTVLEFNLSNSTTVYVKVSSNRGLEIGGTLEMASGTAVSW